MIMFEGEIFGGLSYYILVAVNVNLNHMYASPNLKSTSLKLNPSIQEEISHLFK